MRPRVLLIDDDEGFREDLSFHLGERFEWETHPDGREVVTLVRNTLPDVVLLDIELGSGPDGLEVLRDIRREIPRLPVVMVTRHDPKVTAAEAWRLGAFGFIEKSARMDHIVAQIERAIEEAILYRERETLREELAEKSGRLVGSSPAVKALLQIILWPRR